MIKLDKQLRKYAKEADTDPQKCWSDVHDLVNKQRPNLLDIYFQATDFARIANRKTIINNVSDAIIRYANHNQFDYVSDYAEKGKRIKNSKLEWFNCSFPDQNQVGLKHTPLTSERIKKALSFMDKGFKAHFNEQTKKADE